jgi:uncharacterized protein (DUF1778 family)
MRIDETEQASRSNREARISLRVASNQAALLKRAAESQEKTLTDFVLSSASAAAEQILADRRWFRLDVESWNAFEAALERPAVYKPRLSETVKDDNYFAD